jgi:signal transduction histidine kinase
MAVVLERGFMLDFMRRYELRYTHGQLLGSFVHEMRNKLSGLGDNAASMTVLLRQMAHTQGTGRFEGFVDEAQHVLDGIAEIHTELQELTDAYSKLVTGEMEPVNVNALAEKVRVQMKKAAGEAVADIRIEPDPDLPPAKAIASRLEQILTNLVLNAVQQIRQQRETMRRIAGETKRPALLSRSGLVVIRTQLNPHAAAPSIRVIVMDTGPGIHYPKRRELFVLDKTTRERGQGLGLYISRNMARAMGGQLWLADSVVYLGSVFVVELPVFR